LRSAPLELGCADRQADDLRQPRELHRASERRTRLPARHRPHRAFLVVRGSFALETREGLTTVNEGEFLIVPRGVEHRTVAEREAWVLHFAPEGLVNTGAVREARTVEQPEWI